MKNDEESMGFHSWQAWNHIPALPLSNCLSFFIYVESFFGILKVILVHRKINPCLTLLFKVNFLSLK